MKTKTIKQIFLFSTLAVLPVSATMLAASCGSSDSTEATTPTVNTPTFKTTALDLAAADQTTGAMYDAAKIAKPAVRMSEVDAQAALVTLANATSAIQTSANQLVLALSRGLNDSTGWTLAVSATNKSNYPVFNAAAASYYKPKDIGGTLFVNGDNYAVTTALVYLITKIWKVDSAQIDAGQTDVPNFTKALTQVLDSKDKSFVTRFATLLENWDGKGNNAMNSWSEFIYALNTLETDASANGSYSYPALRAFLMGSSGDGQGRTGSIKNTEFAKLDAYLSAPKLIDLASADTTKPAFKNGSVEWTGGKSIISLAPKISGSRIVKITNEDDAKTYILKSQNKAAQIMRTAISEELVTVKNTKKIDEFLISGKISDLGGFELASLKISNLLINVVVKAINEVWKITGTHAGVAYPLLKNDFGVLVAELTRLLGNGADTTSIGNGLKNIINNFENNAGTTVLDEWSVTYSWANLLHFARLALDPTPMGNFEYEALLAMLYNLGKDQIANLNKKLTEAYTTDAKNKASGGYWATELKLAPRNR